MCAKSKNNALLSSNPASPPQGHYQPSSSQKRKGDRQPADTRWGGEGRGGESPYRGVDHDEHHGQERQGLEPIQVFVSQDPIVLTGDQAYPVDHQLF